MDTARKAAASHRQDEQTFLARTPQEWREIGVPDRRIPALMMVPALSGAVLALRSALSDSELAELRRIARGNGLRLRIRPQQAAKMVKVQLRRSGPARITCADK